MKCSKCNKEATIRTGQSGLQYCDRHFYETIERRIRKDMRTRQRLSTKKEYYLKNDRSAEYFLAKHFLDKIFNKRLRISPKPARGAVIITPRFLDSEASLYLDDYLNDHIHDNHTNPIRTVLESEANELCRIIGIKFRPRKGNEMIDTLAEKHPEIRFSILRSKQAIDGRMMRKQKK